MGRDKTKTKPKPKKSWLWEFFRRSLEIGKDPTCKFCGKTIPCKNNTTNLKHHLERHHKDIYKLVHSSLDSIPESPTSPDHGEAEPIDIDPDDPPSETSERVAPESAGPTVKKVKPNEAKNTQTKYAEIFKSCLSKGVSGKKKPVDNPPDSFSESVSDVEYTAASSSSASANASKSSSNVSFASSGQGSDDMGQKQATWNESTLPSLIDKLKSYDEGGVMHRKITNAILYMIATDHMSLNTPEKKGFKYLMRTVAPRFKLFGRSKCVYLMEEKYKILSEVLKQKFQKMESVALTADLWSDQGMESYVGLTAHFIEDHTLKSVVLGTFPFSERHFAEKIKDWFRDTLAEWRIDENKVVAVVTDGAPNIVSAVKEYFGEDKHMYCYAHLINRIVTVALTGKKKNKDEHFSEEDFDEEGNYINEIRSEKLAEFQKIIKKVKKIVTWFHSSTIGTEELKLVEDLKLIQSCPTRWNSDFYMLTRFVKLAAVVTSILLKNPKSPEAVNGEELEIIKDVLQILEVFEQVTQIVSADKRVTCSQISPCADFIRTHLREINPVTEIGKEIKKNFQNEIARRGRVEIKFLIAAGAVLDPRYKNVHFEYPTDFAKVLQRLKEQANDIPYQTPFSVENNKDEDDDLSPFAAFSMNKAKDLDRNIDRGLSEIDSYAKAATVHAKTNIFEYWKTYKETYPKVYKLAMKYLAVPATSTPSERVFSLAKLIKSDKRNKLSPKHLNMLVFLASLPFEDWYLE